MNILIVEDDDGIRDALEAMVRIMGHAGFSAPSVKQALELAAECSPSLILLDATLLDGSGVDFLMNFQQDPVSAAVPVIMLTSDGTLATKMTMFELGVQDYVCKPFEIRELMARINAVTRRASPKVGIDVGGTSYDKVEKVLTKDQISVNLTQNEDRLFRALVVSREPVPKPELYRQIWGERRVGPRNLDTLVNYLRKKIEPAGLEIKAIYGVGYQLESEPKTAAKPPRS